MCLWSPSAVILEPKKIKSLTVSVASPSICHEVMGPDAMIVVFLMLRFKPIFSLSSLTLIKRLFSSSPLSAIRVVSSAYWRLLTFHLETLIPACSSHNLAFCKMCSACVPACVLSRFSRVDFQGVFPTQGSNPCLMSPALAGRLFAASAFWEALYSAYKLNRQGDKYSLDILLQQF